MEYKLKDLKKFFVKVITTFNKDQKSMMDFMGQLNKYAQYVNAQKRGQIQNLEEAIDKHTLLGKLSSLFAKYDLNDDFNAFLPLQSRGISLLAEVNSKDPQLHQEIITALRDGNDKESIGNNEGKIKEILSQYPQWK